MAKITIPNSSSYFTFSTINSSPSFNSSIMCFTPKFKTPVSKLQTNNMTFLTKVITTSFTPTEENSKEIQQVCHHIKEFDESLQQARNEIVVVAFTSLQGYQSIKVCEFMSKISNASKPNFKFLIVKGDQTDETVKLCKREKVTKVPHFIFYKNKEKVHEEEGFNPTLLMDILFYHGEENSSVVQVHGREDVDKLVEDHRDGTGKLIVLAVGSKNCGPCVKIYPTVINLSTQMGRMVTFARMCGDENESCMEFMREMEVVKVPTFLFIKDGEICGRYVGSNGGELLREIIKCQRIFKCL